MMRAPTATLILLLAGAFARPCTGAVLLQDFPRLGEVLAWMQGGHYQRAERFFREQPSQDPFSLRLQMELARRSGRRDRVRELGQTLLNDYNQGRLQTSDELGQAGFAAWQLGQWELANQIFLEASKRTPVSLSLYVDWGRLYLEKYNAAEAESIFQDALKVSGAAGGWKRWSLGSAYAGLARALGDQFKPGRSQALEKALKEDPENLQAITEKAHDAIEAGDQSEAQRWIQKGLAINKNYLPLLELNCAYFYFADETSHYRNAVERLQGVNPVDADLYETLGDLSLRRRRLEEAVEFYRRSVKLNPQQWSALASLGINLLRLGETQEGRRLLEEAYKNDPYNIWTVNTLRLLDSFSRFDRYADSHFSIMLSKKESGALEPYVKELLERSLKVLEQKYQYQVTGTYSLELYPDHDDFAVRTLGLPGLGALGATFGRVVAMDSSSARPRGEYHWGSTLWHELTHVVTLALSKERVPRWFTEGISMMEERKAGPGWGDRISLPFVEAYSKDRLLPLENLNQGFEQPRFPGQVEISYLQAGWICDLLSRQFGTAKIRQMLVAYGRGLSSPEVFKEVLGVSVKALDQRFHQELDEQLKPIAERLRRDFPGVQRQPAGHGGDRAGLRGLGGLPVDQLRLLLRAQPENYFLNLEMGRRLLTEKDSQAAQSYLQKAIGLFPDYAGADSPYALLAGLYQKSGEKEKLLAILRRWWEASPQHSQAGLKLARLLFEQGQGAEAASVLEQLMFAFPFETDSHELLGDLYLKEGKPEAALREFKVLLFLHPGDLAGAHYRLAEALFQSGKREEARHQVLLSLEIAPDYRQAQQLLLKLVQK